MGGRKGEGRREGEQGEKSRRGEEEKNLRESAVLVREVRVE